MADIYEFQLALDLPGSLPPQDLALLRWHLGEEGGRQDDGYAYPLWGDRGRRCGSAARWSGNCAPTGRSGR
ncbi:hypothetical protein LUX34_05730 [Streptomyces werraensis]|nr:hypothetical protein [Streptomyces werraensis]